MRVHDEAEPVAVGTSERLPDSVTIADSTHAPGGSVRPVGTPDDVPASGRGPPYDP